MSEAIPRDLLASATRGRRLTVEEAALLLERAGLLELADAADAVRFRFHPELDVTYVVDRNINYTNICGSRCRFCAFWREPDAPDAYVLQTEEVIRKVRELVDAGGTQVLMQGGSIPG